MKFVQSVNTSWFLLIVLLSIVRISYQTVYSCNTTASCGCSRNPVSIARIVGGKDATSATWGWAVSISTAGTYLCGGSIISSSWIITAAHCVAGYAASQITIYAGSTGRFSGTQTRVASQVIVHSDYRVLNFANDIALLRLASSLIMNDPYVNSICLPSISSSTLAVGEWPPVGTTVVAVGWGRLSENGPYPSTLQQVTLQTVAYNADTCTPVMADRRIQFCAGVDGGGKDACEGDSGGPLMMFTSSNQWMLVGLTSSGIGCARPMYSGLYTRVAAFQDWIASNTNHSINISTTSISTITSTTVAKATSNTASVRTTSPANTVGTTARTVPLHTTSTLTTSPAITTETTVRTVRLNITSTRISSRVTTAGTTVRTIPWNATSTRTTSRVTTAETTVRTGPSKNTPTLATSRVATPETTVRTTPSNAASTRTNSRLNTGKQPSEQSLQIRYAS